MALTDQRIAVDGPLSHLASQLDHAFADHSIEVKRIWTPPVGTSSASPSTPPRRSASSTS